MVFDITHWGKFNAGSVKADAFNGWVYRDTGDTLASLTASGYFNAVYDQVSIDDRIYIVGTDFLGEFVVTSTDSATPVTVARMDSKQSGSYLFAAGENSWGGGGASHPITITGLLTTDIVNVSLAASANAVTIQKSVKTANTLTITFSGDPGAGTLIDYTVYRAGS